jgi:mRNA interferase YafQ
MVIKYQKLDQDLKNKISNRLKLFERNPFTPILKNHKLRGNWKNHSSINITADIRAIYTKEKDVITFKIIGTHDDLYN